VTVQVGELVVSTSVAWFTPGPLRWKLCRVDMSETFTVYVPGASVATAEPPWVSEIENPGPTAADNVPSVDLADPPWAANTAAATPRAKKPTKSDQRMTTLRRARRTGFRRTGYRGWGTILM
jgi:hypothetical protein